MAERTAELADRILRALDAAADRRREQTPDSEAIRARYSELKRTTDFEEAARRARAEWLARVLAEAMGGVEAERDEARSRLLGIEIGRVFRETQADPAVPRLCRWPLGHGSDEWRYAAHVPAGDYYIIICPSGGACMLGVPDRPGLEWLDGAGAPADTPAREETSCR